MNLWGLELKVGRLISLVLSFVCFSTYHVFFCQKTLTLLYSRTSSQRRTKRLTKFVHLDAVSLYQGSFSYISLLRGKEIRSLSEGRNIGVRLYKYFINVSKLYLADSFPCCVTSQFSAEDFFKWFFYYYYFSSLIGSYAEISAYT